MIGDKINETPSKSAGHQHSMIYASSASSVEPKPMERRYFLVGTSFFNTSSYYTSSIRVTLLHSNSLSYRIFPELPQLFETRLSTNSESKFRDMSGLVGYGSSDEEDDQREVDKRSAVDVCQIGFILGFQPL